MGWDFRGTMYGRRGISLFLSNFPYQSDLIEGLGFICWDTISCRDAAGSPISGARGSLPWSQRCPCTCVLTPSPTEGTVVSQTPWCYSSAQAPLFCWGGGYEQGSPPALPRCPSKVANTSIATCGPRRKGVETENRGTGWLGWVKRPKAQA